LPQTPPTPARERSRLSAKIAIGLFAGVALGLFLGERTSVLQVAADAYIKLLQMTVLPYITVSIVLGLGALTAEQARALGKGVGAVLVLLWVLALVMVFLFPLMFPPHESASFFSTALVEEREPFDFLNLYIPTNPFNSLANSIVPAVVLFSIIVGVALIGIAGKGPLLDVLAVASRAISKAANFVVSLTPYGVFAIAAVLAGTLGLAELHRLEVYLISYAGMSLLIGLWVLPGLVAALTPIPYRAVMTRMRDTLVTAFMTTSLLAVLPLITEEAKALVGEFTRVDEREAAMTDVVVPTSFNFPHTGKVLSLSFLLFAGWFADVRVAPADYLKMAGVGLLTLFGNVTAAIPFLLDLLRIPADTFRLFITSGVINGRFGTLVAASHTLAVAVLGTCAVTGALTFETRKIIRYAVITAGLTLAVVGGTRVTLQAVLSQPYDKDAVLASMRLLRDRGTARVFKSAAEAPPLPAVTTSVLDRIHSRGALRVGYFDDSLPYAFFNQGGDLVGFDVEMALEFARDQGAQAEFVPIDRALLDRGVDPSVCDIVMSGVVVSADRTARVQFSMSYLDETLAFIVPDHRTAAFSEWSSIRAMGPIRVGIPKVSAFVEKVRGELPAAQIVLLDRADQMFAAQDPPLDAVVMTAERGSAFTILHPQYSVTVPKPRPIKVPLAYVIAGRDASLTGTVNTWIELKRKDDTVNELFAHWILGETDASSQPRWSVAHDVLGWLP
jgi:Na+/H+-dicarboxylate symporter